MGYLTGYTIKPYETTSLGEVFFTDGTNNAIRPNQQQCEAYGYTYDRASGTCSAFKYNTNLERTLNNINNKFNGPGNTTELGANTIQINGTLNTAKGFNNNCLISGSNNEIANGVNNATVLGSNGKALIDGEFVIGSGDGIGQNSIFTLNGTTTDATPTDLFVNGDTAVTIIARNTDSVYYYKIDVHAYRTGGASGSGSVDDRAFYTLRGMVKGVDYNETLTTNIGRGTTVGWTAATRYLTVSGVDEMYVRVTGVAAMNITWTATANFYEMKGL
jgi:hypothetical protein